MGKILQYLIIAISISAIIFSIISISKGQSFIDASGGFLIAICLLVVLFIEKRDKKK
jgi:hypothetical protein